MFSYLSHVRFNRIRNATTVFFDLSVQRWSADAWVGCLGDSVPEMGAYADIVRRSTRMLEVP